MSRHRLLVLGLAALSAGVGSFACGDGATEPTITATAGNASGSSRITVANSDRAVLVALYRATDGPNWVDNTNWLTDAPLGDWYGVDTDGSGRVVTLDLSGNTDNWPDVTPHGLKGSLPPELGGLASLRRLNLAYNHLTGRIPPELGSLANLERLYLYSNGLTGPIPPELGDLANLERLYLHSNELTGPLPSELGNLANLERLELNSNGLTGPVPPELGSLANLERLYLGANDLTGPIPPELGGLANLEQLNLGTNGLTGSIPSELGGLTNLEQLYLDTNDLNGPIPSEFGSLANLERLYLHSNALTGPIPPELGGLANLERLYLRSNDLSGPIPSELGGLASLERLYLHSNALTGPIPASFASLDSLESLTVSDNDVCVPRSNSVLVAWLAGVDHDLADLRSCPSDREVLVALYDAAGGPGWTDATNWLTEEPLGSWYGVTVDSVGRLTHLDLAQNGLTGSIAPELGELFGLRELLLDRNQLTGTVPPGLSQLGDLTRLSLHTNRLRGAVPAEFARLRTLEYLRVANNSLCVPRSVAAFADWLAGVDHDAAGISSCASDREILVALYNATDGPNWRNSENWLTDAPLGEWWGVDTDAGGRVVVLDLAGKTDDWPNVTPHGLEGPIPPEIGGLAGLRRVNLAHNRLTGRIPPELGDLANLERLYLDNNALTGPIPPALGSLANLRRLYLDSNALTGSIPPELGGLANLERLNVWGNGLSGPIPPALGGLARLTSLTLGNNRITGAVPAELGGLANLEGLHLSWNALTGPLPQDLASLTKVRRFAFDRNDDLCAPGNAAFADWLQTIEEAGGPFCNESDRRVLESLFEKAGGSAWTNAQGWLGGPVLDGWHGITADSLGRVTVLDLSGNALAGRLPGNMGALARLTELRIANNPNLAGRLPLSLADLSLRALTYEETALCVPGSASFQRWLSTVRSHDGTGTGCPPLSEREALEALYDATGGPDWTHNQHWLTDAPLGDWYGVETDAQGRVVEIRFVTNRLTGRIPPELGDMTHLRSLQLYREWWLTGPIPPDLGRLTNLRTLTLSDTDLTGPIPPELGGLANLRSLTLNGANLTGPIPPELGNLANLERLRLQENHLTGSIPPELARLANLRTLYLGRNDLTGPLPSGLGDLANLRELNLASNGLTGPIPVTLGGLTDLTSLYLGENELTGPLPPEFGDLVRLQALALQQNANTSGALPTSLINLPALETLQTGGTGLCAPSDAGFLRWLEGVANRRVALCDGAPGMAYLVQATQSREFPVPLVAGEEALLRVFVTAGRDNAERLPPVRASFTLDGTVTHVANVPGKPGPIPTEVEDGSLAASANAVIPAEVVRPGLEMVIEIDPDGSLDPGLGVAKRIPETGRLPVEVREMAVLDLTLIPFLWAADPDSAILDQTAGMAADPDGHALLAHAHILLPVGGIDVTRHEPVVTSSNNLYSVHAETKAIRALERGGGHWMGMMSGPVTGGVSGLGSKPGRVTSSVPSAGVIAHELGHNMSLSHAPGGNDADPAFPYYDGSIGVWGYDSLEERLVPPVVNDLMGGTNWARGLRPYWVSDYHFTKALQFRWADEGDGGAMAAESVPSLLLWGGVDAEGAPYLEPAFAVNASPVPPESGSEYRVAGRSADGAELFSLAFAMPELADAGDGESSFAFTLPVRPGWEAMASVTLTGPGGSATLDAGSDRPMAILRNPQNGQVRGILRNLALSTAVAAVGAGAGPGLEVLFSRGIPDAAAWRGR